MSSLIAACRTTGRIVGPDVRFVQSVQSAGTFSTAALDLAGLSFSVLILASWAGSSTPPTVSDNNGSVFGTLGAQMSPSGGSGIQHGLIRFADQVNGRNGHQFTIAATGSALMLVMAFPAGLVAASTQTTVMNTPGVSTFALPGFTPTTAGALVHGTFGEISGLPTGTASIQESYADSGPATSAVSVSGPDWPAAMNKIDISAGRIGTAVTANAVYNTALSDGAGFTVFLRFP